MKLINKDELASRLERLSDELNINEDTIEKIIDAIDDMPYLSCVRLTNGDLKGDWCNWHNLKR